MSWLAGDLARAIAVEQGKEWDDTDNQAQVLGWVNDAYKGLISYYDWTWLKQEEDVTIVITNNSFTLQSSAVQPYAAGITSPAYRELLLVDGSDMAGIDTTVTGRPRYIWISSFASNVLNMKFWPVADGSYTFHIWEVVRPVDLAADATLPLPEEFIPILKEFIRDLLLRKEGDYFGAKAAKESAYTQLELMKRKTNVPKMTRANFGVSDVKRSKDPRLPNLPDNYPGY